MTGDKPEDDASAPRPRDRSATRRVILDAAKAILADKGFAALGVNAVARDAGCDKQLVYRYFGGLEGLVDALGEDMAEWIGAHLAPLTDLSDETYAGRSARLLDAWLIAVRGDPLLRAILAWEVSDPSPQVRRLAAARSRGMVAWMVAQRGTLVAPPGVDAPALNALLIAGLQHLALSAATTGGFAGVALAADADWDRIRAMLRKVVVAVYEPPT